MTTVTSVANQLLRGVGVGVFTTVTSDAIQHLRAVEGEGGGMIVMTGSLKVNRLSH